MTCDETLLEVRNLKVEYGRGRTRTRAVDDVSFSIAAGETLGLVGESGSGKTTIGKVLVGLTDATQGTITFDGKDITRAGRAQRRELAASIQVVFQDPYSSLNPAKTIGQTLVEPFLTQRAVDRAERHRRVREMLEHVGLAAETASHYPAQLSGGQRQRVAIARALMLRPRIVVCDEPVSSLDLSIQAQILNLLADLQDELAVSYLFVAHNLSVVRHIAKRVVVLYRGQVMESGPTSLLYGQPVHPYTRALLASEPVPDPEMQSQLRAERAALVRPMLPVVARSSTPGCVFADRCQFVIDGCTRERPPLVQVPNGRAVACLRHEELAATNETPRTAPKCIAQ
jgi:peptide/nickel transport system ATP-binding protein